MADLTNAEMKAAYRNIKRIWFPSGLPDVTSSVLRDAANSISNWIDKAGTQSDYNNGLEATFKAAVTMQQKSEALRAVIAAKFPS